ncbi:hypothetical protein QBC32DRAFT_394140 [Pseudoneurospora amorphoporcata]|uniref:Uncharacterized protein n=1 Tax=Pseudoneurospora amorphoporcata TaxID=241081 RepID=A0AAN6P7K0_9PEZI|nr:hypothetical protein QBC32DRAFT_394140 [Pseudoneurospora amorphoporcata]
MLYEHHNTPRRNRAIGTILHYQKAGKPCNKTAIFRENGIGKTQGFLALKRYYENNGKDDGRTFHNASNFKETRGRKKKFTPKALAILERFLESHGFDGRTIPWEGLPRAAGLDIEVSGETVRRAVKEMHFRKIRFSDECHFGFGPQGKLWVIRRPWERHCPDCIIEKEEPAEKDKKRLHCNNNGKMSLQIYRDKILEPVVGHWLRKGEDFILEEDNDNGLESYFNCPSSPDFVPIEKAWQLPKQYLRKRGKWDDEEVRGLVEEGWAALSQETINSWVDQIPQILQDCIDLEGAMTGH